jgi:hypothetical protein
MRRAFKIFGQVPQQALRAIGTLALCLAGCEEAHNNPGPLPAVVGAWIVKIPDAPFPLHMFVFHSDGTVEQSNPDAGDPNTSDSNLIGAWRADGDGYRGKTVEITADRTSRQFAARGEISFALKVSGDTFGGTASATFFDASGHQVRGPIEVRMQGERVRP